MSDIARRFVGIEQDHLDRLPVSGVAAPALRIALARLGVEPMPRRQDRLVFSRMPLGRVT